MKDERISNWFTTGSAVEQPREGTLFYEAVIEPRRDTEFAGNEVAPMEQRPNLTLVHDEDDDLEESILRDHSEALDTEVAMLPEVIPSPEIEKETDAWPWEDEVESSRESAEKGSAVLPALTEYIKTTSYRTAHAPLCREDDHSASEDVILCEPKESHSIEEMTGVEETVAQAAEASEPVEAASAFSLRTVNTPKRIGSGQLVPARLTWRPGDPFGGEGAARSRFRWEVMLTSACVTAACGLGCIWLLRTILA